MTRCVLSCPPEPRTDPAHVHPALAQAKPQLPWHSVPECNILLLHGKDGVPDGSPGHNKSLPGTRIPVAGKTKPDFDRQTPLPEPSWYLPGVPVPALFHSLQEIYHMRLPASLSFLPQMPLEVSRSPAAVPSVSLLYPFIRQRCLLPVLISRNL